MKVLQINTVYGKGSTGKIAHSIHDVCILNGIACKTAYRYREKRDTVYNDTMQVSSWLDCHIHNRIVKYTGLQGCFSGLHTFLFLKKVSKFKPDIIHLHNLHGSYINLSLLFRYIKSHNLTVIWTFHDCWPFTGQCAHFTMAKCEKWKTECGNCPQANSYSKKLIDNVRRMFKLKKQWFGGIQNMTIVTPSEWLADLVKESFLKKYPVKVINNGIDLSVFKPTESNFRDKYNIGNKYIVLGVAYGWNERKGLDVFIDLTNKLDSEKYQIVLVGTDERVDKQLPNVIISIYRTQNQTELAEIYTAADVFANPTREENYPTVNMESIACGTPVVTFNTGGSPETLDNSCGSVVPCDDIAAFRQEIVRICEEHPFSRENCLKRAEKFDMKGKFDEYIKLYENCVHNT